MTDDRTAGHARNAQFARRLQTLMDKRGLSQIQLAALIYNGNVGNRVVVWGWVTGRNFPNRKNLEKLARALKVKVTDLVPTGFDIRS